jgi:hypothetical protein
MAGYESYFSQYIDQVALAPNISISSAFVVYIQRGK